MPTARSLWVFLAALFCVPPLLAAEPPRQPLIPAFERFHRDAADAAGGALLAGELNCTACHAADQTGIGSRPAPVLHEVAARAKAGWIESFLLDPAAMKPGTPMPSLLGERENPAGDAKALTHYLASLTGKELKQSFPSVGSKQRGAKLFHEIGCAACHNPRIEGQGMLATSVPLGDLTKKYTLDSLSGFLTNPHAVRPSGRMPSLMLSPAEARDVAAFLLPHLKPVANLRYAYYEGSWQALPDFAKLTPRREGGADEIGVGYRQRNDQFGLRFEGVLRVASDGDYTIHVISDDGCRVFVDDKLVVDNDGIHAPSRKAGKVKLTRGEHFVRVDYFEQSGEEVLDVQWEGPGVARQPIAKSMSIQVDQPELEDLSFEVDEQLAERGRVLFGELGCAQCHQIKGRRDVAGYALPKKLSDLNLAGGCLADKPPASVPNYRLDAAQRKSLRSALSQPSPIVESTPAARIQHTFAALNCYACHQRGEMGGVEEARSVFFKTDMPEMGDEGRLPPPLDGVGAKIRPEYLTKILDQGAKDRPYMLARMPRFGLDSTKHLIADLAAEDKLPEWSPPEISEPLAKVKQHGRFFSGAKGLSCIKCHTFGPYKATGIQAIGLETMHQRLKPDWLHRYLLDPGKYRPGTRMPALWPDGQTFFQDRLDGDAEKQAYSVVRYLSDGTRAAVPEGIATGSLELIAFDRPVIYRNFIQGGGPRAIGVGYPERMNLCFDANGCRLAMLWRGRFIDASRHWQGRGQGFQPPLGESVLNFADAAPLAVLSKSDAAWPSEKGRELGMKFRGYQLDKQGRPAFAYAYAGVKVRDDFQPEIRDGQFGLKRTLTFKGPAPQDGALVYLAAAGNLQAVDGGYLLDNRLQIQISGDGQVRLEGSEGAGRLLVAVPLDKGQATVEQIYTWK